MSVDCTPVFRARLKLRLAEKNEKEDAPSDEEPRRVETSKAYAELSLVLRQTSGDARQLRRVLLDARAHYLGSSMLLAPHLWNEQEREAFDADSDKALAGLGKQAEAMLSRISHSPEGLKVSEKKHLNEALRLLTVNIANSKQLLQRMRAYQLRFSQHSTSAARLEALVEKRSSPLGLANPAESSQPPSPVLRHRKVESSAAQNDPRNESRESPRRQETATRGQRRTNANDLDSGEHGGNVVDSDTAVDFPGVDKQQIMRENKKLLEQALKVDSDVQKMATLLQEISRMQDTLADKVMEQDADIEVIADAAQQTSLHLSEGNEWIRSAITHSASRRLIVLFGLIVITLALLFIDWYKP